MSMVQEFKAFVMRGNVVDLAVGVVIGGAFGAIVTSLVGDLIMPVIGLLMNGVDFSKSGFVLRTAVAASADGTVPAVPALVFGYGKFIQAVINFLIVAVAIFMLVKAMNAAKKKEEAAAPATPVQEILLAEIRDLLKKQS